MVLFVAVASVAAADVNGTVADDSTCAVESVEVMVESGDDVAEVDVNDEVCGDVVVVGDVDKVAKIQSDDCSAEPASSDIHHFNREYPDFVGVTKEKLDSLKGEIDKYAEHFEKNHFVQLGDEYYGPHYGVYEFILDVYKNHSYDDTVIIASRALTKCGFFGFKLQVEEIMNQMRSGTCDVDVYSYDAAHYMKAIKDIELEKYKEGIWYPIWE